MGDNDNKLEVLHKEIDLIQACITRMANNSFLLKGWAITLWAVVLVLAEKTIDPIFLSLVVLVPFISFWYLDSFFLRTEKMYRKMYEWVLTKREKNDFEKLYDLNPHRFENEVESQRKVIFSVTLCWFYGVPVVIVLFVIAYLLIKKGV